MSHVSFLARQFYPDLAVSYRDQRALACEIKLLRDVQSQNAIATAVGQASIYRDTGYPRSVLCLFDLVDQFTDQAVTDASTALADSGGVDLVVRRLRGSGFAPHPVA